MNDCCRDGDDGVDDEQTNDDEEEYCTSPTSSLGGHRTFMSASDDSLASTVTDVSRTVLLLYIHI